MKAKIDKVTYLKPFDGKYGTLHGYKIEYNGKEAFYNSKSDDQKKFIEGQEAEFNEFEKTGKKGTFIQIKPVFEGQNQRRSNFGKKMQSERARYSSFAVSYTKDLVIAGVLKLEDMDMYATKLVDLMDSLDKSLEK